MLARLLTVLLCVFVAADGVLGALPLPDFIKACARDDPNLSECALKQGAHVISKLKNGFRKYGIPQLDPLKVDEIKVEKDETSNVGIDLVAKDIEIHGVPDAEMKDISIQVFPPLFKMKFFFPRVELLGKYLLNGKVLVLPIQGNGDANITMVNLELGFDVVGDWLPNTDGNTYMRIAKHVIKYKMDRTFINLSNLFNGNKLLGDRMNEFMNENWQAVTDELGPPIAESLGFVIRKIVGGIVEKVPLSDIFPSKV